MSYYFANDTKASHCFFSDFFYRTFKYGKVHIEYSHSLGFNHQTFSYLQPAAISNVFLRNITFTSPLAQDTTYVEIPVYSAREGETLEQKKARLVYQSRKRGIKETDLILRYIIVIGLLQ